MRMTRLTMRLVFLLCVVLLAGCQKPNHYHASDVTGRYPQADFHLTDQTGTVRSLEDFRGKVVVLFFGYTHCPDVCPTTLADLAQAMRILGKEAGKVQVVFVTVDPERDTQALLAKFVPAFDPSFLGLRGDPDTTAAVAKHFKVDYRKVPTRKGYLMDHTAFIYMIDTQGKVRLMAGNREPSKMLAEDIHQLLASTS